MEKGFYILGLIFSSLLLVNAIQGTLNFELIFLLFSNKCAVYNTLMAYVRLEIYVAALAKNRLYAVCRDYL